jgi:hypothetical protein
LVGTDGNEKTVLYSSYLIFSYPGFCHSQQVFLYFLLYINLYLFSQFFSFPSFPSHSFPSLWFSSFLLHFSIYFLSIVLCCFIFPFSFLSFFSFCLFQFSVFSLYSICVLIISSTFVSPLFLVIVLLYFLCLLWKHT